VPEQQVSAGQVPFVSPIPPPPFVVPEVHIVEIEDRTRPTPATEKHFTIPQVAQMWSMSETTARRLFEEEEGVLRVGLPSRRVARKLKRTYITLYVPESVLNRVHAHLSRKPS
jgi:AraC-like DNA-binding protein